LELVFTALYFLGLGTVLVSLPLWLVAGYLAGRLGTARTLRGLRLAGWSAVVAAVVAGLLGVVHVALTVAGVAAFGPRVMASRLVVGLPAVALGLVAVARYGLPGLWRAARTAGPPRDPVPAATARAGAEPRLVVAVQLNAVVAGLVFYLLWSSPPAPPFWRAALWWWALLAAVAAGLWARQSRRRDRAAAGRGVLGRLARALVTVTLAAVAVSGCAAVSARASRLPDRHALASHHGYDLGGGAPPAGQAAGHAHHAMAMDGAVSVDDLTEKDLSGPVRRFTLTARQAKVRLPSGRTLNAWTFDGRVPGPELRVRQGDLVEVTLVNQDVAAGVTIHWHGYDAPNAVDGAAGVTQDAVQPGQRYVYRFRARQAGTYWYHSHQHSAEQVRRGLFGALVVEPRGGRTETADIPVLVHRWDEVANPDRPETFDGSDEPERRRVAPGTRVRLRLVNTQSHPSALVLTGAPYRVAAIDGYDLHQPGELRARSLSLAGGGRYDLVFTMPDHPVALTHDGTLDPDGPGLVLSPDGQGQPPAERVAGTFDPADYGTPAPTPFGPGTHYDRRFTLNIDNSFGFFDGRLAMRFRVNGRVFPDVPALLVRQGELVELTFVNRSYEHHPMHLHGQHVLVLSRDGRPVRGSPWWTDTLDVGPGETFEVAFRADNPGVWMDHCHNLEHATSGMMFHLVYAGVSTPFTHGPGSPNTPE
jgi:FtsP/CotA-like multicopper oxidase with cupredoxin domain